MESGEFYQVRTLASGYGETGWVDGAPDVARFKNMYGIRAAANGYAYVADTHNHAIRRVEFSRGMVST